MGAIITFTPQGPKVTQDKIITTLTIRLEDKHRLFEQPKENINQIQDWVQQIPEAWSETAGTGLATQCPPMVIELKAMSPPVAIHQYPMSKEAREGILIIYPAPPRPRCLDKMTVSLEYPLATSQEAWHK